MANQVNGATAGIKDSILDTLAALYDMDMGGETFLSQELVEVLSACTAQINREISVYIRRNGRVADVSVGDSKHVSMPDMRVTRNEDRLCGLRCIHTHPSGSAMLSEVDLGTLKSMRLDCMAALGVKGDEATALYAAYLGEWGQEGHETLIYGPMRPMHLPQRALMREIYEADHRLKSTTKAVEKASPERAILVGIEHDGAWHDSMQELALLAKTAGAQVVGESTQKRRAADKATYIGSGKLEELSLMGSALMADLYLFDDELSAVQLRNLEGQLGRPVVDRTTLILDIFAARAQTREGILQVELAQQRYRLPRLSGAGVALSRLGAGIGTRGPGEKKLEIDRRRIRRRIYELEQALEDVARQRALRRERREKNAIPLVALVGYTNAGKSTLLNAISGSSVLAEDMLFATLDPVVRQVTLPGGTQALFCDTVGFIHKLPHELIRAFRATLEEVSHADLILHVVDCAAEQYDVQMRVVEEVLVTLNAADTPRINVFNKIDREGVNPPKRGDWAHISAKDGAGIDQLLALTEKKLSQNQVRVELTVPYNRYEALTLIRENGRILHEAHEADGTRVCAMIDEAALRRVKESIGPDNEIGDIN